MQKYEYKNCAAGVELQLKAIDKTKREVSFYAAAFGSVDSHGDIIQKGAFAKTIQENLQRCKWLNQHSTWQLVGPVLNLEEDDFGLLVTAKASETTLGNDVLALEADKAYEHSIGYQTILSEYNSDEGTRTLKELRLYEVSSVTWGSNPNTPMVSMKSLTSAEQGDYLKCLRKGEVSAERVEMLELEVLQITQSIQDLLEKSLALPAPASKATPELVVEPTKQVPQNLLELFTKSYRA
jgi:uncharacterized protein